MFPNRPAFFVVFVATFLFLADYFLLNPDSTFLGSLAFGVMSSLFALLFMYVGDKIRKKFVT